jgi:hypothetical protein
MKSIHTLGSEFVRKHEWLLETARSCEVAICGGCAAAIVKSKTDYQPADIDMVTTKANALRFIDQVNHFLLDKSVHFRLYVNSHNSFVPKPAVSHYRIQAPFWLPICLFIVPHDQFRFYRIAQGHLLQLPQDVKKAADTLAEKDGKPRIASEMDDFDFLDIKPEIEDQPTPQEVTVVVLGKTEQLPPMKSYKP